MLSVSQKRAHFLVHASLSSQHTEGNQSFRESQQRSLPFTLPFTLWGSYKHLKVPGAVWSRLQAAAMTLVPKPEGGCEML